MSYLRTFKNADPVQSIYWLLERGLSNGHLGTFKHSDYDGSREATQALWPFSLSASRERHAGQSSFAQGLGWLGTTLHTVGGGQQMLEEVVAFLKGFCADGLENRALDRMCLQVLWCPRTWVANPCYGKTPSEAGFNFCLAHFAKHM